MSERYEHSKEIFAQEAQRAKSDQKTLDVALANIKQWLTDVKFREYQPRLISRLQKNSMTASGEPYLLEPVEGVGK